ncbi:MAG: GDP-mannose 4,6-dehydratase [Candidatus Marinimicrobia bacterium]|nr:GDP-mannose 4,6-dehydratase [Candidatus Neomarinimicrobiota bacterium]
MNILVTGSAGFIGFHVSKSLLERGHNVIGIDNLNNYYDPTLKEARNNILKNHNNYTFYKIDLCEYEEMDKVFRNHKIECICHLAAQAGVRYSLTNPFSYQKSNLEGFLNIIELAKNNRVKNFVYASSSSVYGNNKKLPFSEKDRVDNPISLYAATKKSNELIAYTYSHLFNLPCTGIRFFTVYGPYGRPDMALFKFTKNIIEDKPIDVYNFGKMKRDFTYIDDIVSGVISCLFKPFKYEIFNLGRSKSEKLMDFIYFIEKYLGKKAEINFLPIQPGDVPETYADIQHARDLLGYEPEVDIAIGVKKFIDWYIDYYKINL